MLYYLVRLGTLIENSKNNLHVPNAGFSLNIVCVKCCKIFRIAHVFYLWYRWLLLFWLFLICHNSPPSSSFLSASSYHRKMCTPLDSRRAFDLYSSPIAALFCG